MYCRRCGTENPDNAKLCVSCGDKMDDGTAPSAQSRQFHQRNMPRWRARPPKKPLYRRVWFWAISAFFLVASIGSISAGSGATFLGFFAMAGLFVAISVFAVHSHMRGVRRSMPIAIAAFSVCFIVAMAVAPESTDDSPAASTNAAASTLTATSPASTSPTPSSTFAPTPAPTPDKPLVEEDATPVGYVEIWNNHSEFHAKTVKFIGTISSKTSGTLYITEGLGGLTGMIAIEPQYAGDYDRFSEGDALLVVGRVGDKLVGYVVIDSARMALATDDVKASIGQMTAEFMSERASVKAQAVKEYKDNAQSVSYDSLIREPHKYEGQAIKVRVKIAQLMIGGLITESGYRGNESSGENEWYIHYDLPEGSPRIIEGDTVTFYGEFTGLAEMTRSVTRTREEVPKLDALYHE